MSIKKFAVEKCATRINTRQDSVRNILSIRRMGVKRARDFVLTLEDDDVASQSETESEPELEVTAATKKNKKRKVDLEELNPDFEFDGYGVLGGVKGIDEDGWGFKGVTGMREGAGVDLDGIIARRRGNMTAETEEAVDGEDEEEEEEKPDSGDESEATEDEEDEDEEEFKGFGNDEDIGTASNDSN
jgi:hypothetical protein